ncbi:hypothetical protein SADUNF_Sadunf07G0068500 [Salix dunnii]|uniref:DUF4283 domain-containing protein n=1 Tax=Salix dunnii TaxID=1413687 RepID=A0A835MVV7_9ROSI|nr:hypothetical protein SADUNF_Sadunf07G0068500 [Salix dunnii]
MATHKGSLTHPQPLSDRKQGHDPRQATWANRVRVTDSTIRHTLELVPYKPASALLKISIVMQLLNMDQRSRCMIGFITRCRLPYHAINLIQDILCLGVDSGLPLPLWTKQGLSMTTSMVGKPQSCVEQTINCKMMDYACLCVELDAILPFIHHFEVESPLTEELVKVNVEYKWKLSRYEGRPVMRENTQPRSDVSPMKK